MEEAFLIEGSVNDKVTVVNSWISFMHFAKGFTAQTIASYMSGVRSFFLEEGRESEFFLDVRVSKAKAGCARLDGLSDRESLAKLAIPTIMFESMLAEARGQGTLQGDALAIGLVLGLVCLLRCSEYTVGGTTTNHSIKSSGVEFWMSTQERYVASWQVRQLSSAETTGITEVRVTIPSSKTDQRGGGYQINFNGDSGNPKMAVLQELLDWSRAAYSQAGDHFTSFRPQEGTGKVQILTRARVAGCIKRGAARHGLNPQYFSTHSVRITGATRLRAAGVGDQTIMRMGRWVSVASCCAYQRESEEERTKVTAILAKGEGYDLSDARRALG